MAWQPTHMAILASRDLALAGVAGAPLAAGAGAAGADAWAYDDTVTEATARAKSVVNNLFILRAQLSERSDFGSTFDYIGRGATPTFIPSVQAHHMKFQGSQNYVATQDLMLAVNASITLKRPLLVKGEPGTGKTMLAEEVAQALDMPLLQWHIKSTTKAQQGLYEYDAVSRLRDSQLKDLDGGEKVKDIHNYIVKGVLWQAFTADKPVALLIDEIDKADIEFPNDLLRELDRMEFYVYETREMVRARHRPLVFITSNNEKELPDAFLRRCFFHYIKFPDAETMQQIVDVHFPGLKKELLTAAMKTFYDVRNLPGLKKKPSTSELLDWLKLLVAEDIPLAALQSKDDKVAVPPLVGALLKNEQDVTLFEKLVFMQRHNR